MKQSRCRTRMGMFFCVNGQRLKHYYGGKKWKVEEMPLEDPQ